MRGTSEITSDHHQGRKSLLYTAPRVTDTEMQEHKDRVTYLCPYKLMTKARTESPAP